MYNSMDSSIATLLQIVEKYFNLVFLELLKLIGSTIFVVIDDVVPFTVKAKTRRFSKNL